METQMELAVASVTVYPDRARVNCQGAVSLDAGSQILVVDDLPLVLDPDSVRARGFGPGGARIMGLDVTQRHYVASPAAKVRELEEGIERLADRLRELKDEAAGHEEHGKYLAGMRGATEVYAKGLALGRTSVEDQGALQDFLRREDAAVRAALRDLSVQTRDVERELEKARKELADLQSQRPRKRFQAKINLELAAAGEFMLLLSYVVRQAGWKPLYDARLVPAEDGWKLSVTTLAQVQQQTGQDWPDTELVLSTARPALNQGLPDVQPWYVDVLPPRPQALRSAAALAPAPRLAKMAATVADAEPDREVVAAEEAYASVADGGLAVEFRAPGRVDVPSDGSPRKTALGRYELDPNVDYIAAPRHTAAVFRRLKVVNDSPGPLLPGAISLFSGDEFIGTSRLEYIPRGGEIELMFGVEDRLAIRRELVRRDVDKRLLRDRRQLQFAYEIELQNHLDQEASIELTDQIPVARDERIRIKLDRSEPQPDEVSELNLLTWKVQLASGAKWQVRYDFSVEHPRDLTIQGLHI